MNNSKIEWTDHTFNPWWGCMKVSAGCKNCYAETLDNRWKGGHWGPGSTRKMQSDKYWQQPLEWDKAAAAAGVKAKVFCASMADVFEHHPDDHPELWMERQRLFLLITQTPNLIWQLLTKRPENIMKLIPEPWEKELPENVWIGTSVENQEAADDRIPHLLKVPARVRFLSCEPLIGPVDLTAIKQTVEPGFFGDCMQWYHKGKDHQDRGVQYPAIHWVIAGGESGHGARPMHPDWVRGLRDQCAAADVPFLFKQHGQWQPFYDRDKDDPDWRRVPKESNTVTYINLAGGSGFHGERVVYFRKVGKKAAGRLLDGVEHNEFPKY